MLWYSLELLMSTTTYVFMENEKNIILFYFIARGELDVYPKWIKMIFSQVKEYDIFTSEK